jgi:D-lactate dehydrogenase
MNIAIFSTKAHDTEYFQKLNGANHQITFFGEPLSVQNADLAKGFEAVSVFVNDKVTSEVIEILAKNGIRLIALRCAGYDAVDLQAAENKGIKVIRVPDYSANAIAEHALALIMALNRKTHKAYQNTKAYNFTLNNLIGFNLFGKTVGVVGTGNTGAFFCKIMLGLGCKVITYDIIEDEELKLQGVEYQLFNEVMANSDIISFHCPLNAKTKHMLNAKSLALVKKSVMIINTSRGGIINTTDIIEYLEQGKIGFLGIDVCENELNFFSHDLSNSIEVDKNIVRLLAFPNVIVTPHMAFLTVEALTQITTTTLDNITLFEKSEVIPNKFVLTTN